ncbi:Stealth CR1 domain-containing protein [Parasulfitobacter algicola]|uniref:Stealth CR1 domain-containing protein n=1 Tax=Parasulfitobacter algicola TaxID=2614809 RepID=A0ABX2IXW1_9RHOB|nr:Stealth CR1 domain-containing protein [Sulfitobacter algicola]NSX55013.1 Stealth CR1 domain-containing protein [Sulfitobacter algicola]
MYQDHVHPIDAVVTWVDGNDPAHRAKRDIYMGQAQTPLHENAINPHRWACNDEILYCLQSIENHAPWIRTIWIVIDTDIPDLSRLSDSLRAKVKFSFHRDIFAGFDSVLPTFNSLAIESMIWRIDGLSDRFLYFNDDVFLTAPLSPTDVFRGSKPVLRGKWVDYSDIDRNANLRRDPAKFNHFMQIKAARLMGFDANRLFATAHVVHPMVRSVMAQLFDQYRDAFIANISHRFRDLGQFLPQGLHNHACIANQSAIIEKAMDHLHIKSGQGTDGATEETRTVLQGVADAGIKFLCINDLPQLEDAIPEAREWISTAIGATPDRPCQPDT